MREIIEMIIGWFGVLGLVGSVGTMEISENIPKSSVAIFILSFACLVGLVLYSNFTANFSKEDYAEMQKDLDIWCFGKERENESRQRSRTRKRTQKKIHRGKSGR
jgi:hypothetical protein